MIPKPSTCDGCVLHAAGKGFMPAPDGTGRNGVLLVGEALGQHEEATGRPFIGRAGFAFQQMLDRQGWFRDDFLIDNVVRCRPPGNLLNGQSYEAAAIAHCAQYLDTTVATHQPKALVALGEIPMQRLLGYNKTEKITPHRGFVEWSDRYQTWVIPTFHPAFIMRGKAKYTGVFLHDVGQALTVAKEGYARWTPHLTLDPHPLDAVVWERGFLAAFQANPTTTWLAYDIETPTKLAGTDEEELEVDDPTMIILRVGFAYPTPGVGGGVTALSIPWQAEYHPLIARLLGHPGTKLVHNAAYDNPRLQANEVTIAGAVWDTMDAWHVLNSDLDRGLSFIVSLLVPGQARWKYLANTEPAHYNALDAALTVRIMQVIHPLLGQQGLWSVFDRHITELGALLRRMSAIGIPMDLVEREASAKALTVEQERLRLEMENVVPVTVRTLKPPHGYVKTPNSVEGLTIIQTVEASCERCGKARPSKTHLAACQAGTVSAMVKRWARVEPLTPSGPQLAAYQRVMGHGHIINRENGKPTFDEEALKQLMRRYPQDLLYPLVLQYREIDKIGGTYIGRWTGTEVVGGMPVGRDGRVHTTFTNAPSTLRLSCRAPNLQTIPRGRTSPWQARVKQLFVAEPGRLLCEMDFHAIEARLVGYFAGSERYDRLSRLGIHDYLTGHVVGHPTDLGWSEDDLKAAFAEVKRRHPVERDACKQVCYLSCYGGTPGAMARLYPEYFPTVPTAAALQARFFTLFPEVRRWQQTTIEQANKDGYLRNPYGYLHRFWKVLDWTRRAGAWVAEWGEDAKRALAFRPQSTAAGIIREAMLRIQGAGLGHLIRHQVHDSLLFSLPEQEAPLVIPVLKGLMEAPNPELELPWAPEHYLAMEVEVQVGTRWGEMRGWEG